jgi:transposase InsO family protein
VHLKLRDEFLDGEVFETLLEAQVLIERWRRGYNTFRPHSALGYRPFAPEARMLTPNLQKIASDRPKNRISASASRRT